MDSRKSEKKRNKKIRKKNKRIYKLLFFVGFAFLFLQYLLFEKTSVDYTIVLALIIVSGLFGVYFDLKRYSFTYKVDGYLSYFLSFFQSAIVLGGLVGLFFLSINYYLADSRIIKNDYKILDRYSVRGRKYHRSERKPVFTIKFNNKEKNIKYSHSYFSEMDKFQTITIESQKGFFGYEVIKKKSLKK